MCRSQKPFSPSSSGKGLDHVGDSRSLHQGIHKNRKKERQRKEKKNKWVQSINRGRWIVSLQIHIEKEASEQIKRIHETAISQSQTVSNLEKACKHNKAKNRFESLFPGQKGTYKQSRIKLKKKKKIEGSLAAIIWQKFLCQLSKLAEAEFLPPPVQKRSSATIYKPSPLPGS